MKKIFVMLVMALGAIGMQAQYEWMENAPEKYLPAMTEKIISRASACNQGEEAFMDFIPKFRTDARLRGERIKLDPEDEIGKLTLDNFEIWNIIKAGKRIERLDLYARLGEDREKLVREVHRLIPRVENSGLSYDPEKLKILKDIVENSDLDYYKIVSIVETIL